MQIITGLVLTAAGGAFLAAGLAHKRRILAQGRAPAATGAQSLSAFGEIMRPIILGALVYFGLKASVAWYAFDAGRVFTAFDLVGLYLFLAGYGAWISYKTAYRPAEPVEPTPEERPEPEEADGRVVWLHQAGAGVRRDPDARAA
jgi:hypothetical protein